jgi:hypothetical protein
MAAKYSVHTKYVVGTSSYDTQLSTMYYDEASAQKMANILNNAYDLGVSDTESKAAKAKES